MSATGLSMWKSGIYTLEGFKEHTYSHCRLFRDINKLFKCICTLLCGSISIYIEVARLSHLWQHCPSGLAYQNSLPVDEVWEACFTQLSEVCRAAVAF